MKTINTTAPIKIELLREYFKDRDSSYIIDVDNSSLKGSKLLTYFSNLDIPCDISENISSTALTELLKDYLHSTSLCSIGFLEETTIDLLLAKKGIIEAGPWSSFIDENQDIIDLWIQRLDSLLVFNTFTLNFDLAKEEAKNFPHDDSDSLEGINWVSLLKHEKFFLFFGEVSAENLKFYTKYFEHYMFRGKNLFSFWANRNNPMYLLSLGAMSGAVTQENWDQMIKESLEELEGA